MKTDKFVDDTIVLPICGMDKLATLVTSRSKIDAVIELEYSPDHCVILISTNRYSIKKPAQEVADLVYGAAEYKEETDENINQSTVAEQRPF